MSSFTSPESLEALCAFLDRSPTPYHAASSAADRFLDAGFSELSEQDQWQLEPGGGYFFHRGDGCLVAFRTGFQEPWISGARIAGAHTDSPSLKLKISGERTANGALFMPVEVYGGPIISTWVDRDLGIAGRVVFRTATGITSRLFSTGRAVATIPNLAIHLNRKINEGFEYNRQDHLAAILDVDGGGEKQPSGQLLSHVADILGIDGASILDADLFLYDGNPAQVLGINSNILVSGRIDNLAATSAITEALCGTSPGVVTAVGVLFNHEEVGSKTAEGADSGLVRTIIERIVLSYGGGREELHRTLARSFLVSNDAAHAIHPSYPEKHDPAYAPHLNGGPVLKYNGNFRYTTTAETAASFRRLCEDAGVPVQRFNNRSDMTAGSTIGPLASAAAEIRSVDVGIPILGMHSIRETAGIDDHGAMIRVLDRFFKTPEMSL